MWDKLCHLWGNGRERVDFSLNYAMSTHAHTNTDNQNTVICIQLPVALSDFTVQKAGK